MELSIRNVTKTYGKKRALSNFSLDLKAGVYGLLGPNGAGKSTLIGTITGLVKADSGSVFYTDEDGNKLHNKLGYLPQYQSYYKNYSAPEFLRYMLALKNYKPENISKYISGLLELVNLGDVGKKHIGAFSGGMKQRLGIAQALIGEPSVLIFDEPTAGLDPKERVRFRNIISSLGSDRIVILATHIVSDIEYIANDIILLNNGVMVDFGTQREITAKINGKVWEFVCDSHDVLGIMSKLRISNVVSMGEQCKIRAVCDDKPTANAENVAPDLEDVCLYSFGEL